MILLSELVTICDQFNSLTYFVNDRKTDNYTGRYKYLYGRIVGFFETLR